MQVKLVLCGPGEDYAAALSLETEMPAVPRVGETLFLVRPLTDAPEAAPAMFVIEDVWWAVAAQVGAFRGVTVICRETADAEELGPNVVKLFH